jgi:hypothetical protein
VTQRRRKAVFKADLVVFDEPQLFCLTAGKSMIIVVAVPEQTNEKFDHIAASVTPKNWERYLGGYVDVRYLFTYPFHRSLYVFHSDEMKEDTIMLRPHEQELPDSLLPSHGIFSSSHTEEFGDFEEANGEEQLFIDGEWELNEFGSFYQRYSDIYFFSAALKNVDRPDVDQAYKGRIKSAFARKPFKGGSSYMHMFDELQDCLPRGEKLSLDGIEYNSPGDVRMNGLPEHFSETEKMISNYTINRTAIRQSHKKLRDFLTKEKLLGMAAASFDKNSHHSKFIRDGANDLGGKLSLTGLDKVETLCDRNPLVFAKVMLAIFRRIDAAASFFAEGRMAFEREA